MLAMLLSLLAQDPVTERLLAWIAQPYERCWRAWVRDLPAGYELHRARLLEMDGRQVFEWSEESSSFSDAPDEVTVVQYRFAAAPPFELFEASVELFENGESWLRVNLPMREGYTLREFAWMTLRLPLGEVGEEFTVLRLEPWTGMWEEQRYLLEAIEARDSGPLWRIVESEPLEAYDDRSVNWVDAEGYIAEYRADDGTRLEPATPAAARAAARASMVSAIPLECAAEIEAGDSTGVLIVSGLRGNPFVESADQSSGTLADGTVWVSRNASDELPTEVAAGNFDALRRACAPDLRPVMAALWQDHGGVPEEEHDAVRSALRILDRTLRFDASSTLDPVAALHEQSGNAGAHRLILVELLRAAGLAAETRSGLARHTNDAGVMRLQPRYVVRVFVDGRWIHADPVSEDFPLHNFYEIEYGKLSSWYAVTTPESAARYVPAADFSPTISR